MSRTGEFTCEYDPSHVAGVCGECGTPLCSDCENRARDPTFLSFSRIGPIRLLIGIVLLVGVPILLWFLMPKLILDVTNLIIGGTVFLRQALVYTSIIIGLALVLTTWWRSGDLFTLLGPSNPIRILCDDCYKEAKRRGRIVTAVRVGAVIVAIYGIYALWTASGHHPNPDAVLIPLVMTDVWIIGLAVSLYLVSTDFAVLITALRE